MGLGPRHLTRVHVSSRDRVAKVTEDVGLAECAGSKMGEGLKAEEGACKQVGFGY